MGPNFKDQEVQEEKDFLSLEDGTDIVSPNVGTDLPLYAA
jgi:hypothetical protein